MGKNRRTSRNAARDAVVASPTAEMAPTGDDERPGGAGKKKDANGVGQGVVAWDVEVTNQDGDLVASYDILTLVAKRT